MSNYEFKESFDSYLMFDFSNFQSVVAQTLNQNNSEDLNRFAQDKGMKSIKPKFLQRVSKDQAPGPFYITQFQEFENLEGDEGSILFGGDLAEDQFPEESDDSDIQEIECFDLFLETGNLKQLNLRSQQNEKKKIGSNGQKNELMLQQDQNIASASDHIPQKVRPYLDSRAKNGKTTFFSIVPYQTQESNQMIELISLENIQLLCEQIDYSDFYKFLNDIQFLNFHQQDKEDHFTINQIRRIIQIKNDIQKLNANCIAWSPVTQTSNYTSPYQFFRILLEQFIEVLNFIIDKGNKSQNHQKPLRDIGPMDRVWGSQNIANSKVQVVKHHLSPGFKANPLSSRPELDLNVEMTAQTSSLAIVIFKYLEILEQKKMFDLCIRDTQKFKELERRFTLIKTRLKSYKFFTQTNTIFQQKAAKKVNHSNIAIQKSISESIELTSKKYDWVVDNTNRKIRGLDVYFNNQISKKTFSKINIRSEKYLVMERSYSGFNQYKQQKTSPSLYLYNNLCPHFDFEDN